MKVPPLMIRVIQAPHLHVEEEAYNWATYQWRTRGEYTVCRAGCKWKDQQEDRADIEATSSDRGKFSNTGCANQLGQTSSSAGHRHPANGYIYAMCSSNDDHSDANKTGAEKRYISPTHQIGYGTGKG